MELPLISHTNVSQYFSTVNIVQETAEQIMKDFGLFGVTILFSGDTSDAYHELHEQLITQVTILLEKDYGRLLSVLYQVDITDKEIAQARVELPHYSRVELIAHQIIVRDLKKVLTRHYFKANQ